MKSIVKSVCTLSVALIALSASAQPAGAPRDYAVFVGKRAVLASTLNKSTAPAKAVEAASRDYVVFVGKRAVLASSLPRTTAAATPASCRDYVVVQGKRAILASKAGIPSTSPNMPNCCVTNNDCHMDESCCPS